jgi:acyl-CoA-binding protein
MEETRDARETRLFTEASEKIKRYNVPQETQLKLYGLYKQALFGDNNNIEPGFFDFRNKVKYDAWSGCKGMPKTSAMKDYILLARSCYTRKD